ncbi:hypothetical protein L9F63_013731, partial [Diploptera punctata]
HSSNLRIMIKYVGIIFKNVYIMIIFFLILVFVCMRACERERGDRVIVVIQIVTKI